MVWKNGNRIKFREMRRKGLGEKEMAEVGLKLSANSGRKREHRKIGACFNCKLKVSFKHLIKIMQFHYKMSFQYGCLEQSDEKHKHFDGKEQKEEDGKKWE